MKSILKDYYGININEYKEYSNGIVFFIGGDCYYLFSVGINDVSFIDKVAEYIKTIYKVKLHSFIKNINGEYLSDGYILMKLNVLITDIDLYDVKLFSKCNMNNFKSDYINVIETWNSKLDYYSEIIKESLFNPVRYLVDYFISISEMLVKFIRDIDFSTMDLFLSHKKDYSNTIDYYNPINISVDVIDNDLVRYYDKRDMIEELMTLVVGDYSKRKYLFFKLVFPYDFFELLEVCIKNKDVNKLFDINIHDYENRFDKYQELLNFYLLPIKKSN